MWQTSNYDILTWLLNSIVLYSEYCSIPFIIKEVWDTLYKMYSLNKNVIRVYKEQEDKSVQKYYSLSKSKWDKL